MRLIHSNTLTLHEFVSTDVPPYAIFSHTWSHDEVSFQDFYYHQDGGKSKASYRKIHFCTQQAMRDGLEYSWIDTVCIDKSSSAELSEAVNSMFRWYQRAARCYVYLQDVSLDREPLREDWVAIGSQVASLQPKASTADEDWLRDFQASRWWTRGWTLQELIAPAQVLFFSREWQQIGTRAELEDVICKMTGIHRDALRGRSLSEFSIDERLSWAEKRHTTRVEDGAYCLLGLFDINIPLLYGEGGNAYQRLAEEIVRHNSRYRSMTNKDMADFSGGRPGFTISCITHIKQFLKFMSEDDRKPVAQDRRLGTTFAKGHIRHTESRGNLREVTVPDRSHPAKSFKNSDYSNDSHHSKNSKTDTTSDSFNQNASTTISLVPGQHAEEVDQDDDDIDDNRDTPRSPSSEPEIGFSLGEHELRIITLDAGIMGAKLVGKLRQVTFSSAPPFYALSYTWGDEPDLHPIVLNGVTRHIRSNLYNALQRIRQASGPIHIWVDSICINQNDEIEKEAAVNQMADIYRNAVGVMVWLGEKDSSSDLALSLVAEVVDPAFSWQGEWWLNYSFVALAQMLERPWFRRRWVIQEAALSSNTTIYCGDRQVYMTVFTDAIYLIRTKLNRAASIGANTNDRRHVDFLSNFRDSPAIRLLDTVEKVLRRSSLPLATLVDLARFTDTSDHRDTIYALLSLSRNNIGITISSEDTNSAGAIKANYQKSVLEVYAEFITQTIAEENSLDIICRPWAPNPSRRPMHNASAIPKQTQSLPSWVAMRDRLPFGDPSSRSTVRVNAKVLVETISKKLYTTHHNTKPKIRSGLALNPSSRSLFVNGFVLGKISKVSMRMSNAIVSKDSLQVLIPERLRGASCPTCHRKIPEAMPGNHPSRPFGVPDVIWRTLCADRDEQGNHAPTFYRSAMSHLIQRFTELPTPRYPGEIFDVFEHISGIDVEELLDTVDDDDIRTFLEIVRDVVWNRRTFKAPAEHTSNSHTHGVEPHWVGLAPQLAKRNDAVCVLYGCSVPVVLREHTAQGHSRYWELIGEAYVDGIMDGELFDPRPPGWIKEAEVEFELR